MRSVNQRWTSGVLAALALGGTAFGQSTYFNNFENDPLGSLPAGWSATGDGFVRVVADQNHTGIRPPWDGPDFGMSGERSLGMTVGAGMSRTSMTLTTPPASTGAFETHFALRHEGGLDGQLRVQLFGDSPSPQTMVTEYLFDLTTGASSVWMLQGDGSSTMMELGSVPDLWTEHMVVYGVFGVTCCDHCPNITYWNHNSAAYLVNFTSMTVELTTTSASLGGSVWVDDVNVIVPAPGAGGLILAAGAWGLLGRRRR